MRGVVDQLLEHLAVGLVGDFIVHRSTTVLDDAFEHQQRVMGRVRIRRKKFLLERLDRVLGPVPREKKIISYESSSSGSFPEMGKVLHLRDIGLADCVADHHDGLPVRLQLQMAGGILWKGVILGWEMIQEPEQNQNNEGA